jgi:hypothetical protein
MLYIVYIYKYLIKLSFKELLYKKICFSLVHTHLKEYILIEKKQTSNTYYMYTNNLIQFCPLYTRSGTDVMISKVFSPKFLAKILAFLLKLGTVIF